MGSFPETSIDSIFFQLLVQRQRKSQAVVTVPPQPMQVVPHIVLSFSVFWSAHLDTVDIKWQKTMENLSYMWVQLKIKQSLWLAIHESITSQRKSLAGPFFATEEGV